MIHDREFARDLAEARAQAAPRATERSGTAAEWFALAVAFAIIAMMLIHGWRAA